MTDPVLQCFDLDVGYSGAPILRAVSLSIDPGSRIALVGPSGSGKTTLLASLGGLHSPLGGHVEVQGRPVGQTDLLDAVAWIPQTANSLMRRTVLENAALGALGQGVTPQNARQHALAALDLVGLSSLVTRKARELSGGERQRLAVARAIATGRPLLFADEPTGQLDARTSEAVADAMLNSSAAEQTVVVSTHDLALADRCDQVIDVGRLCDAVGGPVAGQFPS